MGRSPCCSKEGLNRGAWTAMEDKILTDYITLHGEGKWRNLPKRAGLKRCGKSCRLRWLNYLRPDIKRGNITRDEEELIIRLHNLLGNRWSLIAGRLPGRTDNEIKNYWNTNIGKRIQSSSPKTTCRRITPPRPTHNNTTKPSSSPTHHHHPPPPPASSPKCSRVVRTRATRCTKAVLLPPAPPNHQPRYDVVVHPDPDPDPTVNDDIDRHAQVTPSTAVDGHQPSSVHNSDGRDRNSPGGFAIGLDCDAEVNDRDRDFFLSDFLSVDCLQHFSDCFGDIVVSDQLGLDDDDVMIGHVIEPPTSSSRSSDHHGGALLSSLIDPELDWLLD